MHYVGRFDEASLKDPGIFQGRSEGAAAATLIDHTTGSVHTGLAINQLQPGGRVEPHVHSFEQGFYVLSGDLILMLGGRSHHLVPGDFAVAKVGTPHAWYAPGPHPGRLLSMSAPQPKPPGAERDTFFLKERSVATSAPRLDLSDTKGDLLGHFDKSQIPPVAERSNVAAGLEGVFLKWMIDEEFGARHHRMLFIEYQPGVGIGLHDHTFEEAYFILEGEVQATLDGQQYTARAGDVVWTSVGCVHAFRNVSSAPVRWLETFSPQPPKENVFRFMAEWDARVRDLEGQ